MRQILRIKSKYRPAELLKINSCDFLYSVCLKFFVTDGHINSAVLYSVITYNYPHFLIFHDLKIVLTGYMRFLF